MNMRTKCCFSLICAGKNISEGVNGKRSELFCIGVHVFGTANKAESTLKDYKCTKLDYI